MLRSALAPAPRPPLADPALIVVGLMLAREFRRNLGLTAPQLLHRLGLPPGRVQERQRTIDDPGTFMEAEYVEARLFFADG